MNATSKYCENVFWRLCIGLGVFLLINTPSVQGQIKSMKDLSYPFEMQGATLSSDVEIAYTSFGTRGPDMVLVHGLASYAPAWIQQIETLSQDYRVWVLDLPGFGRASKTGFDVSLEKYADFIVEWSDMKGLDSFIYVGHSMGGQIGLHLAHKYSERVQSLVLIAPAGFETFTKNEGVWLKSYYKPEIIAKQGKAEIQASYDLNFHSIPQSAKFMIRDRMLIREAEDFSDYCRVVADAVTAMLDEPVFGFLHEIQIPTLVIYGEEDQLIPNRALHPGTTEKVAEKGVSALPKAEYHMISNAGHFVHFEEPQAVNLLILDWITSN